MWRISIGLFCAAAGLSAVQPQLVYPQPDDGMLEIRRDITYRKVDSLNLHFDLYRPRSASGAPLPVVLFMNGVGAPDMRAWPQYTGWAKIVAGIGMAGVVFDSREGTVAEDTTAVLDYLRAHADDVHVDAGNVILWACSSNVSAGLPYAMDPRHAAIQAAVIYYGASNVADLRTDLPVMMVRAGLDGAGLNRAIDTFVGRATTANLPLTFLNLPAAHHGFDLVDDNEISRMAIRRTLDFIREQSAAGMQRMVREGVTEAAAASAVYRGDSAEAVKSYTALAAARPTDSEVHRNFGNALAGAGEWRRALAEFERALELGNTNVGWIAYSAAQASWRLGDREATVRWIEKLKGIKPMQARLSSDPEFDPVKNDPRVKAVLAQ